MWDPTISTLRKKPSRQLLASLAFQDATRKRIPVSPQGKHWVIAGRGLPGQAEERGEPEGHRGSSVLLPTLVLGQRDQPAAWPTHKATLVTCRNQMKGLESSQVRRRASTMRFYAA